MDFEGYVTSADLPFGLPNRIRHCSPPGLAGGPSLTRPVLSIQQSYIVIKHLEGFGVMVGLWPYLWPLSIVFLFYDRYVRSLWIWCLEFPLDKAVHSLHLVHSILQFGH